MQTNELVKEEQATQFGLGRIERPAKALLEGALHLAGEPLADESRAQLLVDSVRSAVRRETARCEDEDTSGEKKTPTAPQDLSQGYDTR